MNQIKIKWKNENLNNLLKEFHDFKNPLARIKFNKEFVKIMEKYKNHVKLSKIKLKR